MTDDASGRDTARRNEGYLDLRELIERFDEMGELARIDGADWNLEIGALSETSAAAKPGRAKTLLFDNIPGYPEGFRVMSGAANAYRRLAVVLGLDDPENEMTWCAPIATAPRRKPGRSRRSRWRTGRYWKNIDRDGEVDLLKFPGALRARARRRALYRHR